jgi:primary-amine oxidase
MMNLSTPFWTQRVRALLLFIAIGLTTCLAVPHHVAAQDSAAPSHPLDPLNREEVAATVTILKDAGRVSDTTRFWFIRLNEPPKEDVLAYRAPAAFRREAFVNLYDWSTNKTSEAVIDLQGRKIISWKDVPGVQPGRLANPDSAPHASDDPLMDDKLAEKLLRADPRWQQAMRRHGVADLGTVEIWGSPLGGNAPQNRDGSRLVLGQTSFKGPATINPIVEGVGAIINLTTKKVESFYDQGLNLPTPSFNDLFHPGALPHPRPASKPLQITQPQGANFEVRGHEVRWQSWRFRFGIDPRVGVVLYTVSYQDQGKPRPILYRGSLSEMIVPYGDPPYGVWSPFDSGEYGMFNVARSEFSPLADAPENAAFFSAVAHTPQGTPLVVPRAVALYERYAGVLWRHGQESRPATELVLSFFAMAGNYDYGFNWVFHLDGTLEMELLLTGECNSRTSSA